jgi:hypothetical protein
MSSKAFVDDSVKQETGAGESPVVRDPVRQGRQLWTAEEIGEVIRRSPRQTHHLLQRGAIKSAKKFGGRWTASEVALRREFGDETA